MRALAERGHEDLLREVLRGVRPDAAREEGRDGVEVPVHHGVEALRRTGEVGGVVHRRFGVECQGHLRPTRRVLARKVHALRVTFFVALAIVFLVPPSHMAQRSGSPAQTNPQPLGAASDTPRISQVPFARLVTERWIVP